jgi:hypothetical protein
MLIAVRVRDPMIEVVLESHQIIRRRGIAIVAVERGGLEISRALVAQVWPPIRICERRIVVGERDAEAFPVKTDQLLDIRRFLVLWRSGVTPGGAAPGSWSNQWTSAGLA